MAVFVDLEDDDVDIPQPGYNGIKPLWHGTLPTPEPSTSSSDENENEGRNDNRVSLNQKDREEAAHESAVDEEPNSMTVALGCYPVVMAVAAHLDLNDLDSLSRTCRGVHNTLLQYRSILLKSTLRCANDDLPVDPESTLRYRARAGNWFYMEDSSRGQYNGKAGSCARDMVSQCRKCNSVVCRNCAIKPPAPAVFRDRHRRLCNSCQKSPIGRLMKPAQSFDVPLLSHAMQGEICRCATDTGVWLCQPCGRGIRGSDSQYRGIWRWRTQYGEVLGGLGTGIGDADRGVECARGKNCLNSKYIEHETDCDAEDAREAEDLALGQSLNGTPTLSLYSGSHSWSSSHSSLHSHSNQSPPSGLLSPSSVAGPSRTPSPSVGPGYARHEVEGIGNKIKTIKMSMIRVGCCVPEWEDEKTPGQALRREVGGEVRSWCGWCDRVIPSKKDHAADGQRRSSTASSTAS